MKGLPRQSFLVFVCVNKIIIYDNNFLMLETAKKMFLEQTGFEMLDVKGRINSQMTKKYHQIFLKILDDVGIAESGTAGEMMALLRNNLKIFPSCLTCGNKVRNLRRYCSNKCAHTSGAETFQKAKLTNLSKYGVTCNLVSKEAIEKRRETGCGLANPKTKEKQKKTLLEKYGVQNSGQIPSAIEKTKQTFEERYGGHPSKNMSETHLQKLKDAAPAAVIKRRVVMEKQGYWMPQDEVEASEKYRREVWRITNKNATLLPGYDKEKRGLNDLVKDNYQVDHKVSITFGFISNISPEIIGHVANLQFIPWRQNAKKYTSNCISIEELLSLINI